MLTPRPSVQSREITSVSRFLDFSVFCYNENRTAVYFSYIEYHTITTIILIVVLLSQKVTVSLSKSLSLANSKNLVDIS